MRFATSAARCFVLGRVHFRGKASGIEMRHPFAWVCEMRDGTLARMLFYSSHAEAREAVGSLSNGALRRAEVIELERFCAAFSEGEADE
jgi:hypothetical protein